MAKANKFAKLGDKGKKAFNKHKGDDTRAGNAGLPEGIENGIARLIDIKFDTFKEGKNKGELFFLAAGTVVEPKTHDGAPVEGLRTQIGPEPLCDTPDSMGKKKTLEDHMDWMLNELRKLGVETDSIEFEDLDDVAEALKKEKPFFRFRTWKGKPGPKGSGFENPRVQHEWSGVVDYESATTDDVDEGDDEGDDSDDESLGALADGGDVKAEKELRKQAKAANLDPDDYATWVELEEALGEESEDEDEDTDEEEESEDEDESGDDEDEDSDEGDDDEGGEAPDKGGVYTYKPKGSKKAIEVEVTAVFPERETCNLKDEAGKLYKGVPWDQLG